MRIPGQEGFLFMGCGTLTRSWTELTLDRFAEFLIRCPFPSVIAEPAQRREEWWLGFPEAARCDMRTLGVTQTAGDRPDHPWCEELRLHLGQDGTTPAAGSGS